jgi:tetratricopeptide (TPR) repeat protein
VRKVEKNPIYKIFLELKTVNQNLINLEEIINSTRIKERDIEKIISFCKENYEKNPEEVFSLLEFLLRIIEKLMLRGQDRYELNGGGFFRPKQKYYTLMKQRGDCIFLKANCLVVQDKIYDSLKFYEEAREIFEEIKWFWSYVSYDGREEDTPIEWNEEQKFDIYSDDEEEIYYACLGDLEKLLEEYEREIEKDNFEEILLWYPQNIDEEEKENWFEKEGKEEEVLSNFIREIKANIYKERKWQECIDKSELYSQLGGFCEDVIEYIQKWRDRNKYSE